MGNIVYWDTYTLRVAPRTAQPNKRETHYLVTCEVCGFTRWLNKQNAKHALTHECKLCVAARAGKAGYQATTAKYGRKFFLEKLAERELEKPSKPEYKVSVILSSLGVNVVRQYIFEGWILDFYLPDHSKAIEVVGYWHKSNGRNRDQKMLDAFPSPVLFIDASEVKNLPNVINKIKEFIGV